MEHKTEVSSTWEEDEEAWYVCCTCGWDTHPAHLTTREQAKAAAAVHVEVRTALQDPLPQAIAKVWKRHADHLPIDKGIFGVLQCTCGEWSVLIGPIGFQTASEQWLLHFTEKMREALQPFLNDASAQVVDAQREQRNESITATPR